MQRINTYRKHVKNVWKHEFVLDEIPKGSYLCVAVNGEHGREGAYAGFKIDGQYVGCPNRAPSYPCNPFEYPVRQVNKGYTYFLPLSDDMIGKKIEAYTIAFGRSEDSPKDLSSELWITAYPIPFASKTMTY